MATHFLPMSKYVSFTSTPQGTHQCQVSWKFGKITEEVFCNTKSFRLKIILSGYHGNTLLVTVKKCVMLTYILSSSLLYGTKLETFGCHGMVLLMYVIFNTVCQFAS